MALKSSREGLRKELVDYLGNIIVDDNLRNEIVKAVSDKFVTPEVLNENVNNLTMQITTESGERIEADNTLQNNITAEVTARENADNILQNNINAETTARQEAITNLEQMIGTSGFQMDLLWENASPTSAFEPQTISLDLSQYKCVLFIGKATKNIDGREFIGMFMIGNAISYRLNAINTYISIRDITIYNDSINFTNGWLASNYNIYGTGFENNNDVCVPIYIYGLK